ncbi:SDR family NAD(P)-dependent oxidoreductase [Flexivirga sp. B27]
MTQSPRSALVTASTAGIGRAVAELLHRRGMSVTVHGRSADSAAEAARSIGDTVSFVYGDMGDPEQVQTLADRIGAAGFDIFVHCAGPYAEHTYDTATPADWESAYRTNVVSAVQLATAALAPMRERGFGRVILIGTRATRTPIPTMIEYSAAKAALASATISLARSAVAPGVTLNMVSPGVILTPAMQQMFLARADAAGHDLESGASSSRSQGRSWAEIEASITTDYAPNPQQRLGRSEDVAAVVAFLTGDDAGYVNGADIPVDGGMTGTH